jgi:hypothetical protein
MAVLNIYHHGKQVPAGAVNIMRGTIFGNPYVIGPDGTREEVVEQYRRYAYKRILEDPQFAAAVKSLHNQDVCCCCAPAACHGDVLLKAAAWLNSLNKE